MLKPNPHYADLKVSYLFAGIAKKTKQYLAENPAHFDPRQYLTPARANIKEIVKRKIVKVLGSDGKI